MNHPIPRPLRRFSLFASLLLLLTASHAAAVVRLTQRESLTPEEVELVRENQELDKRTAIFVKAVERRLAAITGVQPTVSKSSKSSKKEKLDEDEWGVLPESTRPQLLADIARILDEAVTNIDDAALHNEKSPLIPKALRHLAAASARMLPQLTSMRAASQEEVERQWLEKSIESLEEIIAAAGKLPAETEKKR
ncbi:MAG TPA: hypothetical protein VGB73_00200 [Pyrinomonadaceae bacterium]|jgi:hypothetical protein